MKGIVITTEATTTDLIVDLDGNVGATDTALEIDMDGTGATTVTMDGTLTSTTGVGLSADVTARATGAVMITTSAITSSGNGIRLVPHGSGAVTITANGNIDSDANAISVSGQEESSGNVNIIASGTLDGERGGIHLIQAGTGAVDVEASGNITSASGRGVYVASSKGISVDIDTTGSTVQAKNEGVRVGHDGAGFIKVTTDDVTSTDSYGIRVAGSLAQTGNLEVTANGDITGGITGIWTYTPGTGETIVTTAAGTTVTGGHTAMGSNAYALRVANQGNLGNRDDRDGHIHVTTDGNLGTSSSRTEGGMWVTPRSFGDAMVTVNGDVFASADSRGVFVEGGGIGALNVYINGDVDGGTHGVDVEQVLRTSSYFSADNVIRLTVAGSVEGDIGVQVSGANAVHDSTITVTGTSSITGTDGTALDLGGVADHNVTLQSGSTLTGKIDASGATGAVSLDISGAINVTSGNALELGGAANHTVILREGANIAGRIEKISGATGNVEFRIEGDISENPLVWKDTFDEATRPGRNTFLGFGPSDSILIADGARVQPGTPMRELPGEDIHFGLNNTPVNLAGRLVFSGLFDEQQAFFARFNGIGGAVEIDLDFSRGDRERTGARFSANNLTGSTENIPVHIRAVGGLRGLLNEDGEVDAAYDTDGDGAITITNVITSFTLGTRGKDHFVAGDWLDNEVDDGDWELALVFDDSGFQPVWSVVARPGAGGGPVVPAGPATLFDTLPAVLAHLGQPESMHRRTQNRSFQPSTGVWGKVQTRRLSVEPSAASFESNIHNVTFGVQAPIHTVTLGADVTLQTAETEAVIADGKQDIETNALIAGLAATWERDDLYVDGQFQYARFDNDLNAADGTKLASPTADSFSAGVEVGYVLDAGNLKLGKWLGRGVLSNILVTPSAQVSWSQIGFSDFVAADGKTVSLDDGTVIKGRVGIVAETLWESVVLHEAFAPASVRLQGSADVIVPLDGEVVTQVDGANQLSELEDPVLDVGIGVFYTWELGGHAYTLSGDISSRQGSEVEGYEGSLGFKYRF